jgi:hypothetical protein
MKKSRILSSFRIEYRRNKAPYQSEVSALRWIKKFFENFSIDDSSQIRLWQIEYFLSELKKSDYKYDDLRQARHALRFLLKNVLQRSLSAGAFMENDTPEIFAVRESDKDKKPGNK